ncbi:MAG: CoB--CoM heterodisulfide reductase iron-sulfur subunit A family protein [ANME-2 cluster archaeon]|nr:CoB--CoM heterodisulfide reductase iron-sulfur subunit A family protein [ANME-2 cluster archaeon]
MSGGKIGVYLCRCGGNISDVVDIDDVAGAIKGKDNVASVTIQDYLCSSAGQGSIEQDIRDGNVDKVVIGSCSPKLHLETFRKMAGKAGINPMVLEITNLREQDSWVHPDEPEQATSKAKSLITGAVARMAALSELAPIEKDLVDRVLVVGGGIAGITTALELADDHEVVLVEKEPYIGGHMIGLSKTFPTYDCSQCTLTPKMVAVYNHPNITMFTNTEVDGVQGNVGDYTVALKHSPRYVDVETCTSCGRCAAKCPVDAIYLPFAQAIPQVYIIDKEKCIDCGACAKICPVDAIRLEDEVRTEDIKVGSVVIATGFKIFDVSRIEEYTTDHPDIITAVEFEDMLSAKSHTGMRLQKADGTMPKRVAFVLCVGSRDFEKYNKHCSRVCCLYSMKQAHLVKKMNKDAEVTIFYIDMRAAGRRFEEFYYNTQKEGVQFIRGRIAEITPTKNGDLKVRYEDTLLNSKEEDVFDMVVLCPSLEAAEGSQELARQLNVPIGDDGFIEEKHVKIDPVSSLNQAVYMAGCSIGPKDIHDSVTDGISAAHKTHQFLGKGRIAISPEKPVINDRCDECGICIEECPYDALSGPGRPKLEPLACTGCGVCAAVCPQQAIDIQNYTREQLKAQVMGMLEAGPGVIVFIDPAAYAAADLAGVNRNQYSSKILFVQVPSIHILDADIVNFAFKSRAGGVMLVEGTTDERLVERSNNLYKMLKKETRQHKKPIRYSHVETAQYEKMGNLFNVFAQGVKG